jgi:hypothetical protein
MRSLTNTLRTRLARLERARAKTGTPPAHVQLDWNALLRALEDESGTPAVSSSADEPDEVEERIRQALGDAEPIPARLRELRPSE